MLAKVFRVLTLLAAATLASLNIHAAGPWTTQAAKAQARLRAKPLLKPDLGLSSRFLPARLVAEDESQVARFRALAQGFRRDSTRHFRVKGRILEVTQDLLSDMAGPGSRASGFAATAGVDIGIERVWDRFAGSDTLVVAALDAGIALGHPELKGRTWVNRAEADGRPGVDDDRNGYVDDSTGWDFVDGDNHLDDRHGSGDQSEIAEGIRYALANGADVINFSIGGGGGSTALRDAFRAARDKGVPIVAAAGNEGLDVDAQPTFPSSYAFENMVVVGSHGPTGAPSDFSNYGNRVHVSAPGEHVLTLGIPDRPEFRVDGFEGDSAASRWAFTGGLGISADRPMSWTQCLAWTSGGSTSDTLLDTLDFTGTTGATVAFQLAFSPSGGTDFLILEANRPGSSAWEEIAVIGDPIPEGSILEFALRGLDGEKVRLRIRTQIGLGRTASARVLRIDLLTLITADPVPASRDIYNMVHGTSIAAPFVAAYVGMQRLACDRMGIPWTRAKALEGIRIDSRLAGKNSTGARLDAYKGLESYLNTLPGLVVTDSTALSWTGGQKVEFSMQVNPQPGPVYRLLAAGLTGSVLDTAAGRISWVPMRPGSYSLKLVAEGPPSTADASPCASCHRRPCRSRLWRARASTA